MQLLYIQKCTCLRENTQKYKKKHCVELASPSNVCNKCVFVFLAICVSACARLCSSISGPDYKAPLFLA